MNTDGNPNSYDARPTAGVWFCLLAGPLAWAFQSLASWLLLEGACAGQLAGVQQTPGSWLRWSTLGISLLALAAAGGGLVTAIRLFRRDHGGRLDNFQGDTRPRFLSGLGVLVSGVFMLAIFWAAWAPLTLPLCEAIR